LQREKVAAMTTPRRLEIQLDAGAEPIQGAIGPAGGPTEPFSGYMQLIALLERQRTTPSDDFVDEPAAPLSAVAAEPTRRG
jgi:hypothetical protein